MEDGEAWRGENCSKRGGTGLEGEGCSEDGVEKGGEGG